MEGRDAGLRGGLGGVWHGRGEEPHLAIAAHRAQAVLSAAGLSLLCLFSVVEETGPGSLQLRLEVVLARLGPLLSFPLRRSPSLLHRPADAAHRRSSLVSLWLEDFILMLEGARVTR